MMANAMISRWLRSAALRARDLRNHKLLRASSIDDKHFSDGYFSSSIGGESGLGGAGWHTIYFWVVLVQNMAGSCT
jgi:hypothetical protein